MTQSLAALLESMRRSLRADIRPELSSDHARTQLAGVVDILAKLESMISWAPDPMRERLDLIDAGCAAIERRAAEAGHAAPGGWVRSSTCELHRQVDVEQALGRAEQRLAALTDWLFADGSALPPGLRRELDQLLRDTLRSALAVERRLTPRADFSSMTGAAAPAHRDAPPEP